MYVYPEPRPWTAEPHRMPSGETIVTVVDALGMPVWWPNLYHVHELRDAGKSFAVQQRAMKTVASAFNWAEDRGIDLEDRIQRLLFLDYAETKDLQAYLQLNRLHDGDRVVGNGYWIDRCRAARNYVCWRAADVMQRLPRDEQSYVEARTRLDRFAETITAGIGRHYTFKTHGLDEEQQATLLFAITPGSSVNPFAKRHQFRNFAIVLALYELGCRNGELLGLKRQDLMLSGGHPLVTIERRQNDPDDIRSRPALAKTLARPLPLSAPLASVLNIWLTEHFPQKKIYPGAKRSPYVFVSEEGRPLALNSVERLFVLLRDVEGLPSTLSAHKLRHTWNDRFSKMVDEDLSGKLRAETEMRMRNFLNGWSPTSSQGEHYRQRFVEEKSHKMMLQLQALSAKGASRS